MTTETTAIGDIGALVRHWRQHRRLSQQALSNRCGVSTRHLSCIETGKAQPSPTMIGQLSEALDVRCAPSASSTPPLYPADTFTRDLLTTTS